jgi:hypothetical protein
VSGAFTERGGELVEPLSDFLVEHKKRIHKARAITTYMNAGAPFENRMSTMPL